MGIGRLPPTFGGGVDWLVRRVEALEREVRQLKSARALSASSFRGGVFIFQDDNGNPRFALGNVQLSGFFGQPLDVYGFFVYGDGGRVLFAAREGDKGVVYPATPFVFHDPATKVVTSSSFTALWEAGFQFPAHELVWVRGRIQTPASTTAEVRLLDRTRNVATDVVSVPASADGFYEFRWLHLAPTGLFDANSVNAGSFFIELQVRRASGAGNVTVFPPETQELTSPLVVTGGGTNGGPVFS